MLRYHRPVHAQRRSRGILAEFSNGLLGNLRGEAMSASSWAAEAAQAQIPAFLQLSRSEISRKFEDLHWDQQLRLSEGVRAIGSVSQWTRPQGRTVHDRNRYLNIDPFSNNRVRLKVPPGMDDYINASPIVLKGSRSGITKRFIATQGPKESSQSHLWRMIWTETGPPSTPAVIIMLTQTHEAGREKCFAYYPLSLSSPTLNVSDTDFGDGFFAQIELLESSREERTRTTLRKMRLTVRETGENGEERQGHKIVWHYLFSGWPDFTVPEEDGDKAALMELTRASAQRAGEVDSFKSPPSTTSSAGAKYTPPPTASPSTDPAPRIVHCSAGVGRSGTFIALDHLLSELEDGAFDHVTPANLDPIATAVDDLRKQRMMMVQGEPQFHFLYELLRQAWLQRHSDAIPTSKARNGP